MGGGIDCLWQVQGSHACVHACPRVSVMSTQRLLQTSHLQATGGTRKAALSRSRQTYPFAFAFRHLIVENRPGIRERARRELQIRMDKGAWAGGR